MGRIIATPPQNSIPALGLKAPGPRVGVRPFGPCWSCWPNPHRNNPAYVPVVWQATTEATDLRRWGNTRAVCRVTERSHLMSDNNKLQTLKPTYHWQKFRIIVNKYKTAAKTIELNQWKLTSEIIFKNTARQQRTLRSRDGPYIYHSAPIAHAMHVMNTTSHNDYYCIVNHCECRCGVYVKQFNELLLASSRDDIYARCHWSIKTSAAHQKQTKTH